MSARALESGFDQPRLEPPNRIVEAAAVPEILDRQPVYYTTEEGVHTAELVIIYDVVGIRGYLSNHALEPKQDKDAQKSSPTKSMHGMHIEAEDVEPLSRPKVVQTGYTTIAPFAVYTGLKRMSWDYLPKVDHRPQLNGEPLTNIRLQFFIGRPQSVLGDEIDLGLETFPIRMTAQKFFKTLSELTCPPQPESNFPSYVARMHNEADQVERLLVIEEEVMPEVPDVGDFDTPTRTDLANEARLRRLSRVINTALDELIKDGVTLPKEAFVYPFSREEAVERYIGLRAEEMMALGNYFRGLLWKHAPNLVENPDDKQLQRVGYGVRKEYYTMNEMKTLATSVLGQREEKQSRPVQTKPQLGLSHKEIEDVARQTQELMGGNATYEESMRFLLTGGDIVTESQLKANENLRLLFDSADGEKRDKSTDGAITYYSREFIQGSEQITAKITLVMEHYEVFYSKKVFKIRANDYGAAITRFVVSRSAEDDNTHLFVRRIITLTGNTAKLAQIEREIASSAEVLNAGYTTAQLYKTDATILIEAPRVVITHPAPASFKITQQEVEVCILLPAGVKDLATERVEVVSENLNKSDSMYLGDYSKPFRKQFGG